MQCDVLVVGAGPAGLAASITASSKGLKTVLVEKSSEIGYPVKSSAITFREVLDSWKLPEHVMFQWYDSFYVNTHHSKREVEVTFNREELGTLNYHVFLQELAFKAARNGTRILLSEIVKKPILDGDDVIGAKTSNREIRSKVIIDCSGPSASIGKKSDYFLRGMMLK